MKDRGIRKICGCPRRKWGGCDHPWHFGLKWKGVRYRFSLDKETGEHVTKERAVDLAADYRKAIKAGTFRAAPARTDLSLRQLADEYLARYVDLHRAKTARAFRYALDVCCRTPVVRPAGPAVPFGDWPVREIVTDSIERFREARLKQTREVGVNRSLRQLRALFNWAIRTGYVDRTPFRRESVPVVAFAKEHARGRRLHDEGEAQRLLAAAGPHLRAVIECALETGMRRGEILSLQWQQITGMSIDGSTITWAPKAEIVLPWTKTKTRADRRIPISRRLRAILEMRRFAPAPALAGEAAPPDPAPHPPEAFVFGTEIGTRVTHFTRAWCTAVLKSHGVTPEYTRTANLTPESRAELQRIGLHFHDLRREAGSRWLQGGVPLHTVRDWLGHTSIAQTSTYLAGTTSTQHDAMRQFEEARERLAHLGTEAGSGGPTGARTAEQVPDAPRKSAVGRDRVTMS